MNRRITTICLFLLALIVIASQFLWLNILPPGMNHDEIEYALSSKTYAMFGQDLSGVSFPLSLISTNTLGSISAIPPLLMVPFRLILPLNQMTARLPYVLMIIAIAGVLAYTSYLFFKKKYISYIAFVLFLLNPWGHFLSHFAVDPSFALFFYLAGIVLLIRGKKYDLYLSFLAFILGFFSYTGAKLIMLPIILVCLGYRITPYKNIKAIRKELIFLGATVGFYIVFFLISKLVPNTIVENRLSEIIFFNQDLLAKNVNLFRTQAIASPYSAIFINKTTEGIRLFMLNYFNAFSPESLFMAGDPTSILSYYFHGLFYWIDVPLLFIGSIFMIRKQQKIFLLLLTFILISPLATAASTHGEAIVTRSFLMLPILILISSYGFFSLSTLLKTKLYRIAILTILTSIVFISYTNFLYLYFFRLPLIAQENFMTSERVLAKYLHLETQTTKKNIIVVTSEPREQYLSSIFYSTDLQQSQLLKQNKNAFLQGKYAINTITYIGTCPKVPSPNTIYITRSISPSCTTPSVNKTNMYVIANQSDSGKLFQIANSSLCNDVPLATWKSNHSFSDYSIETMDRKTFCQRWITL